MSQKNTVIKHLKKNGSITSMQAYSQHGITRLADVIYKIRKNQPVNVTLLGKSRYARYWLPK